ncbi:hypothetical protein ACWCYL_42740 [Streptomyces sp. 900105755]
MRLTRRLFITAAAVLATAMSAVPPPVAAAGSVLCTSTWAAVQRVAVRKPVWNEGPVATAGSPVVRYLRKGERVTSCVVAVGRDASRYRECGGGSLWRVVPGGQVPARCLERV